MDAIEFVVGGFFFFQDLEKTIIEELHGQSPELVDLEVFNVSARTPVLTGALLSDVSGEPGLSVGDKQLAFIYSGTTNQLDEYGRVYDVYQEGGNLGKATYTNGPHEMYAKILTDDIPAIETWGTTACQDALDRCAAGTGVRR